MSNPQNLRQYPSERYYYGWYGGQQQPAVYRKGPLWQ